MAGIYCADIYCDDCTEQIKARLLAEGFKPDARGDDSDDFPGYADDDGETDCPQHCGSGEECCNALTVKDSDGKEYKVGCLIGTSLTSDGVEYVKKAVQENDGLKGVLELWRSEFSYIDFGVLKWEVEPKAAKLDRARVVELLTNVSIECRDDESDETLRAALVANVMDGTIEEWELD